MSITTIRVKAVLCVFACSVDVTTFSAFAQCTVGWQPTESLPGTDGIPEVMATWDPDGAGPQTDILVVGGAFTVAGGRAALNVATWNGVEWTPLGGGLTGQPRALASHNGNLFAGGSFGIASRVFFWNGAVWQPLGGSDWANGLVNDLAFYHGELYAAGSFNRADGTNANRIARWNGASWQPLGTGLNDEARCLAVFNDELFVGGRFTTAGGVSAFHVARWNGSTWAGLASPVNNGTIVDAFAIYNNELVVGGDFTRAGSTTVNLIAAWDGNVWHGFANGLSNGGVLAITAKDSDLVVGGWFMGAPGVPGTAYIAKWNGAEWQAFPGALDERVQALTTFDGQVFASGQFQRSGNRVLEFVGRFDNSNWQPVGENLSAVLIDQMTSFQDRVYAAGQFVNETGTATDGLAVSTGTRWELVATGNFVTGSLPYQDDLIVFGSFTSLNGLALNRVARWDGLDWHPLGLGIGPSTVYAAVEFEGNLVVAGGFNSAGGVPATNVARWDGISWSPIGGGTWNGPPNTLAVYNDRLIAGGTFTMAGGTLANSVAMWSGSAWQAIGTGITRQSGSVQINAMTVYNQQLVVGGYFDRAGGLAAQNVARWTGSFWLPLGIATDLPVNALTVADGDLLIAGYFRTVNGVPSPAIVAWNWNEWHPLGSGIQGQYFANAISVLKHGGSLLVGGSFSRTAQWGVANWARWGCAECPGDLDNSGVIELSDLASLLSHFATMEGASSQDGDMDADGDVDLSDLATLLASFGTICP